MSLSVTVTNAFTNAATSITQTVVKDAITKLAEKYGFDTEEAMAFLMGSSSVQVNKNIPFNVLPWYLTMDTTFSSDVKTAMPNATSVSLMGSKNSLVAKNGFRAEVAICSQENIKQSLEIYFNSPIKCLTRIHGKKYDIKIKFENGIETTIQNKDGDGKGRGWSVDRRKVEAFKDEQLVTLLKTLCLKQGTVKPIISDIISKNVINMCILGVTEEEYPKYFTHTKTDKSKGNIISMSICHTDTLMAFMYGELYKVMEPKRTCVHLSPNCYLQRKGGGKKDANPDNIQMKFRFTEAVEKLFTIIFTQTMSR